MEDNDDVDRPTEKGQKRVAKHDSGAADLEKVTDYAEEREVFSQDISRAINLIDSRRTKEAAEKLARERELAKVSIKKEDVEVLVRETEVARSKAERILRECQGSLADALLRVIDS